MAGMLILTSLMTALYVRRFFNLVALEVGATGTPVSCDNRLRFPKGNLYNRADHSGRLV
jgi:hypothetical protein